jgi:hypothetical protein
VLVLLQFVTFKAGHVAERHPMSDPTPKATIATTINFDRYAHGLLKELAGSSRRFGAVLGSLIMAEYARREARKEVQEHRGVSIGK